MAGKTDYSAQAYLNWLGGQLAMPANALRYLALFQTAPTSDAGVTGAVEVPTGGGTLYARAQFAGTAATSTTTVAGNATLTFSATPAWLQVVANGITAGVGCSVTDLTAPSVIPAATTISSVTATTVVMSANASGAGVGSGDTIVFSAFPPAVASSGAEPATTPATLTNGAIIPFPTSGSLWGLLNSFGVFDASTAGNCLQWDWMGAYKYLPFSCTSASPGVLTSPAHGLTTAIQAVVSAKPGGTLPTTAGSWAGLKSISTVTTDTFNLGVNTTSTGDGLVRGVLAVTVAGTSTFYVPVGSLIITDA